MTCRDIMVALTSPPFREVTIPQRLSTLAEGLFEVVSHALLLRPGTVQAMLPTDGQSQSQFFAVWLAVAQIRSAICRHLMLVPPDLVLAKPGLTLLVVQDRNASTSRPCRWM